MPSHWSSSNATTQAPIGPCWLEVDLSAISANVRAVRGLLGPSCAVAAVVKANAYGLGAVPVARAALSGGARWLAVARVGEAVELRQAGLRAPILNLAYFTPEEAPLLVQHEVTPTIADLDSARALASALAPGQQLGIHLKLDTGLSRFGAQPQEAEALLRGLAEYPALRVDGVYSHLASADEDDLAFARQQVATFRSVVQRVTRAGHRPMLRHLANSAGALALPEARLDLVRLGITLSGNAPAARLAKVISLRPAVALRARLARVFELPAGASIGYNRTVRLSEPRRVGLVPLGYADGLPRAHSAHGALLVAGGRAPLLGRVSMDQCVVDLSALPAARPGDRVTAFGDQAGQRIDLDEFAAWDHTIAHEALCRIGPRVPRHYLTGPSDRDDALLATATSRA